MAEESMMEQTRRLLRDSEQTIPEVYAGLAKQGSDITFFWLRKFSSGGVKDPSVNRVEALHRYLTGKSLTETI